MSDESKITYTEDEAIKAVEYIRKAKARALRSRVELKLLIAKAKKANITVTKQEVDDYIKANQL